MTSFKHRLRTRTAISAVLAGSAALLLGACSTSSTPTADGNTLERLQEDGSITLAIADERPYSWVDENGEPTGATIAMHKEIFAGLGIANVEVVEVDWNSLIPGLNAGRFDAISAGMSILPDRCEQAAFSDPEIMYTTALAVPKGNPEQLTDLDSIAARNGEVTLAVLGGAVEADYARELGIANTLQVDNAQAGIEAVQNGRADAFTLTAVSLNWMAENRDDIEVTGAFVQSIDGVEQIGAGGTVFRKADSELLEAYNEQLAKITGDEASYLSLVEDFGFTAENLPPTSLTTAQLCSGELD
ncbi:ectoine/hydroxyectoine ABC transporter substrate-binding protein EhuB [Leucobacter aridicollis]|uniref:ectoine/hydroxyectoine ABC transporter substrate-binding protein EhuB n=1 Tax=Leucobacter aridicollis TaxID=283878 RepID=UPI002103978F|nr:ectoine/hydroxyectoine ABC transporter substrate-binding protein EhuB [Leucobacter aridicollis]UTX53798.1 ectoine/hydroxyectoine ABC transporter substrate-binding protein EhuB [Leucobacter aridicollis]